MLVRSLLRLGFLPLLLLTGCGNDGTLLEPEYVECAQAGEADEGLPLPPESPSPPDASAPELRFAVSRFYLGDEGLDASKSTPAWEEYGFNLDRTVSTEYNWCSCQLADGTDGEHSGDGPGGRDNIWGRELLFILRTLQPTVVDDLDASVQSGAFSWILRLQGVGDASSHAGLTASVHEAAPLTGPDGAPVKPAFDGSDVWPIAKQSVVGFDPDQPLLFFADAYVVPGPDGLRRWVGRGKGRITLRLPEPLDAQVVIHDPVLVLPLSADGAAIDHGMLGGTLDPEQLVTEVERVSAILDPTLCSSNSKLKLLASQLRKAVDIRADLSPDYRAPCDRVSIGIAFDAVALAGLGPVVSLPDPAPSPCEDSKP